LIDTFGIEKVKALYVNCLECQGILGRSFARLEREWWNWLAERKVGKKEEQLLLQRFGFVESRLLPRDLAKAKSTALFDDRTLNDWNLEHPGSWTVKNRAIVGTSPGPWHRMHTKKRWTGDIAVRVRLRLLDGNAVQVRLNRDATRANEAIFATWESYLVKVGPGGRHRREEPLPDTSRALDRDRLCEPGRSGARFCGRPSGPRGEGSHGQRRLRGTECRAWTGRGEAGRASRAALSHAAKQMWIVGSLVLAAILGLLLLSWLGRSNARWGASAEECGMPMTGDEWLDDESRKLLRMTRAVWIDAPPEQVWPWLAQLGRGAGWYSIDRLDNGSRTSARHIVSWIPEPQLGDALPIGYLRHLEGGRELVWWLKGGQFFGAYLRGVMIYRVTSQAGQSRLLIRVQADAKGLLAGPACWIFRLIDSIMVRRQLLGIKDRVERYGARREDPESPETGDRDQYQLYHAIYASGEEAGVPGREDAPRWRRAAIDDGVIGPSAS
jgi:hypothetical protein